jgi:hypothetical protein
MAVKKQRKSEGPQIPEIRYGGRIISILINAVYYKLSHVLIICESEEQFRLLVIHNNTKLMDETYKRMKNARISFEKTFKRKRFYLSSSSEWSDMYEAELPWVKALEDTPRAICSTLTRSSNKTRGQQGKQAGGKKRTNRPMRANLAAAPAI